MNTPKTNNEVSILHRRYVQDDADKKAALQEERVSAHVARMIRDMRERANLSQKELADLIGTGQSAISRLEDADYEGHSLRMLQKVAEALEKKLVVQLTTETPYGPGRIELHQFLQLLRRNNGLTVDELAKQTEIPRQILADMERSNDIPEPFILTQLSDFYQIPRTQMLRLAGVVRDVDEDFVEHASKFAAQSESFDQLTSEEKNALDAFMKYLRSKS
jgi:transcriptional regulator with XRE-family HTH domain